MKTNIGRIRPISIDQLFEEGYSIGRLSTHYRLRLENLLKSVNWIKGHPIYDQIPDWFDGVDLNKYDSTNHILNQRLKRKLFNDHVPRDFASFTDEIINFSGIMKGLNDIYRYRTAFLDLWEGAENLPWHWDGGDPATFLMLIYFSNEKEWTSEDGGVLEVGKRSVDNKQFMIDYSDVRKLNAIIPVSGTVLIINNRDPRFVHQVTPVINKRHRIVLTAGFDCELNL